MSGDFASKSAGTNVALIRLNFHVSQKHGALRGECHDFVNPRLSSSRCNLEELIKNGKSEARIDAKSLSAFVQNDAKEPKKRIAELG